MILADVSDVYNPPENLLAVQEDPFSRYSCRVIATFFNSSLLVAKRDAPNQVEQIGLFSKLVSDVPIRCIECSLRIADSCEEEWEWIEAAYSRGRRTLTTHSADAAWRNSVSLEIGSVGANIQSMGRSGLTACL